MAYRHEGNYLVIVVCEYSKFWIESNSYFRIRFNSKRAQLFEIFVYLLSLIFYLFISYRLTNYRQKYQLPVALFNYRSFIALSMRAPMHSMYLIVAADHTSIKRRRYPFRPHTCAVDGGGVGMHIRKANMCSGCSRHRTKLRINGTDVNYITTALRLPGG